MFKDVNAYAFIDDSLRYQSGLLYVLIIIFSIHLNFKQLILWNIHAVNQLVPSMPEENIEDAIAAENAIAAEDATATVNATAVDATVPKNISTKTQNLKSRRS